MKNKPEKVPNGNNSKFSLQSESYLGSISLKNINVYKSMLIVAMIFALSNMRCTEEENFTTLIENYTVTGDPLLTYSSEMEITTHISTDLELSSNVDIAAITPMVEKQKVDMELYEDGSVKITTEKMDASQSIDIPHTTLPNPDPIPHKSVMFGNELSVFDVSGELILHSNEVPISKATKLVEAINELGNQYDEAFINQVITNMQSNLFLDELEAFLANPSQYGTSVQELDDDFVAVTVPNNLYEAGNTDETVLLMDRNKNLTLASRLYDADGNWKSTMMFQYEAGDNPIIKGIKQVTKEILPSGIEVKMETFTSISNIQIQINL